MANKTPSEGFCYTQTMGSRADLPVKALEAFGLSNVDANDIKNVKTLNSQLYALGPILTFDYKDKHYYLVDDYSLGDNTKYVRDIIEEINHSLNGGILKNPEPQSDGAIYATGIGGIEYYLWESAKV